MVTALATDWTPPSCSPFRIALPVVLFATEYRQGAGPVKPEPEGQPCSDPPRESDFSMTSNIVVPGRGLVPGGMEFSSWGLTMTT